MAESDRAGNFSPERYRTYLLLLARMQLDGRPQSRIEPSDIVQQTLLEAHAHQQKFVGGESEYLAWLRRVLVNNVRDACRAMRRDKRDIAREQSLDAAVEQSSLRMAGLLVAEGSSPSRKAIRAEDMGGEVTLWNLTTGQRRALRPISSGGMSRMVFSPDSKTLASGTTHDSTLRLWDVASGAYYALGGGGGWAHCVAFSPDGTLLAQGSADEVVRLWNAATRQLIAKLRGHTGQIQHVAFSPDGRTLVSADEATIRFWNVATHEEQTTLQGFCGDALAFTPDGKILMTVNDDGATLKLWKLPQEAGRAIPPVGQYGVHTMALAPDGMRLACSDGTAIQISDMQSGRSLGTLYGHSKDVTALCYGPDGRFLASASPDGSVRVWDMLALGERAALRSDHGVAVCAVWTPDAARLAAGYTDGTIVFWDPAARKIAATLLARKTAIQHLAFSGDGKLLLAVHAGAPGLVSDCWDLAAGKVLWSLNDERPTQTAHFSPDGRIVATAGFGPVRLWDASTRQRWPVALKGQTALATVIAFSPDGKSLALGTDHHEVQLWDLASGGLRATFTGHTKPVTALAFTRDGRQLVSGSGVIGHGWWVSGGELKIWATDAGCRRATLRGDGAVKRLVFSPDGQALAAASGPAGLWNEIFHPEHNLRCWDVLTGQAYPWVMKLSGHSRAMAFSPDGRWLATAGDRSAATVWDAATGRVQATLNGHAMAIRAMLFTPDGKTLISAGEDRSVRLWDLASQSCRSVLAAHQGTVSCLAVSADGRMLASGDEAHSIVLWDLAHGSRRSVFAESAAISALAYSPDAMTLVAGCVDGKANLWDIALGKPRASLRGHEGSVLLLAYSPDGRELTSIDARHTKFWWDTATGRRTGSQPQEGCTAAPPRAITVNPLGNLWAGGSDDGRVELVPLVSPHTRALEHWNRAGAQTNAGQPVEARAELAQAAELEPDNAEIWHDLTVADQKSGDWAHALDDCTAAIARSPENELCHRDRGNILHRLRRWKEAAADYSWVVDHRPDDANARSMECAAALLLSNDHAAYRVFCAKAVQNFSTTNDPRTKSHLARLCALEAGGVANPAQPLEWARQAAASDPAVWHIHVLGLAQLRAGQPEQALKSFQDSIASSATWSHIVHWQGLALAYHQFGKYRACFHGNNGDEHQTDAMGCADRHGMPAGSRLHPMGTSLVGP